MQVSLYTVTQDLREMLDSAFDPETGEALPTFEEKRALWGSKATGLAAYILNIEADAHQCKAAMERIKSLQASIERKAQHLKDYLAENMKASGISEVKGEGFCAKLYVGRDESVELEEGATFPPELCADPKPPAPSKTKIKAAILAGQPIAGARIIRRDRLALK
jgi:hypothetical protein